MTDTATPRDESWREEYLGMKAHGKLNREFADEWAEIPVTELDDASYAQRLEEEERYQRSRATELPEQHEGMGRKCEEIPDPWFN